jgi:hypothetical protein
MPPAPLVSPKSQAGDRERDGRATLLIAILSRAPQEDALPTLAAMGCSTVYRAIGAP